MLTPEQEIKIRTRLGITPAPAPEVQNRTTELQAAWGTPSEQADAKSAEIYHPSSPAKVSTDTPFSAGAKATANVPSSLVNLGFNLLNAAAHPINTLTGIGNATLGAVQSGVKKTTGYEIPDNTAKETFNALSTALKDRYGSWDNLQRTATNDPAGFGADVFSILEGGASLAGKGAEFGNLVSKTAEASILPIRKAAQLGTRIVGETEGALTGTGYGVIKEGMNSAMEGGTKGKAFQEGLRGKVSPEQLVDQAKTALETVENTRNSNYQEMLKKLKPDGTTYNIEAIKTEADTQLGRFKINKKPNGTLDFSRSKFALDPGAQNDITKLYDYVQSYGTKAEDATALGVDNLKQVLGGYYSPNSDYRAFTDALRSKARQVIENAPGYSTEMKNYSEMTENIRDIKQSLSLGDKTAAETAFKKLTSALRTNNDFRRSLIAQLDEVTGGTLSSKIAGQQLSEVLPRGLVRTLEVAGGGAALVKGVDIVSLLISAISTSPRVVGEFINALGVASNVAKPLINALNGMSKGVLPTLITARTANQTKP